MLHSKQLTIVAEWGAFTTSLQYRSQMKNVSFCLEKKLHVKNQNKQLFIQDQYCQLAVKAPYSNPEPFA